MSEHSSSAEGRVEPSISATIAILTRRRDVLQIIAGDDEEPSPVVLQMREEVAALTSAITLLESRPTPSVASEAEIDNAIDGFEGAAFNYGAADEAGMEETDLQLYERLSEKVDAIRADLRARLLSGQQAEARLAKLAAAMADHTPIPGSMVGRGTLVIGIDHWADSDVFDVGIAGSHVEDHKTILGALNAVLDALPEPTR